MPKSIPNKSSRSSAAIAATARPAANAKREAVPGYTTARPSAARDKAVVGFKVAKPEPQLDSNGSDTHQLMKAAAAIVTAAKPGLDSRVVYSGCRPGQQTASHRDSRKSADGRLLI